MAKKSATIDKPAKAKPKRAAKAKQGFLPDLAPPTIPELDRAAEAYVNVRDGRMELTKQETAKQAILLQLMRDKGLKRYEYEDSVVEVDETVTEKVKVKKKKVDED